MITPESHQHSQNLHTGSNKTDDSYGHILGEITSAIKGIMASEANLFMTELQHLQPKFSKHMSQIILFSAVMILSVPPFIAFLVIGLGEILNNQYWLSALIVSLVFMLIGLPMVLQGLKKLKNEDFKFTQTKRSLRDIMQTSQRGLDKIKTGSKGSSYESESYN